MGLGIGDLVARPGESLFVTQNYHRRPVVSVMLRDHNVLSQGLVI